MEMRKGRGMRREMGRMGMRTVVMGMGMITTTTTAAMKMKMMIIEDVLHST